MELAIGVTIHVIVQQRHLVLHLCVEFIVTVDCGREKVPIIVPQVVFRQRLDDRVQ